MPARPRAANDAAASDTPADAARVVPLPRPSDTALVRGDLRLGGRLDARFFALLRAVQDTGSLQKAARAAGYSYKGAWLLLESAGNLARSPLVERATGGRGGGGSVLTPAALQLLAAWQQLQIRHAGFLREQEAWLLDQPGRARRTDHACRDTLAQRLLPAPHACHGAQGAPAATATCRASPASRPATCTGSCSTSATAGARTPRWPACWKTADRRLPARDRRPLRRARPAPRRPHAQPGGAAAARGQALAPGDAAQAPARLQRLPRCGDDRRALPACPACWACRATT
jgi:molybdate transport repressor ModE-like protein